LGVESHQDGAEHGGSEHSHHVLHPHGHQAREGNLVFRIEDLVVGHFVEAHILIEYRGETWQQAAGDLALVRE